MNKLFLIAFFLMSAAIAIWCFYDSYKLWSLGEGTKESAEMERYVIENLSSEKELFCEAKPGSVVKLFESAHTVFQQQRKVNRSGSNQFSQIGISVLLVGIFQLIWVISILRKNEKNQA